MEDLWYKRSVGIKLWGVKNDPHEVSKSLNALSRCKVKGDPWGKRNVYPENQMHIIKLLEYDDSWGDGFESLISDLGGVDFVKKLIVDMEPKKVLAIINLPIDDYKHQKSNDLSKESIFLLHKLSCNLTFNFF